MKNRAIFCVQCECDVEAYLTDGSEVYPHRNDLHDLPFWKCDKCNGYVGCHHKTKDRTRPLGNIPTKEIRNARKHIHALLDPMWDKDKKLRTIIYEIISSRIGYKYHTANIKSINEA